VDKERQVAESRQNVDVGEAIPQEGVPALEEELVDIMGEGTWG
jgi:hypothetical protein